MKKKVLIRLTLVLLLAALLVDSHCRLTVSRYDIQAGWVPEQFEGYTIVQLSDLHAREFGRDNKRLVSRVAKLCPDMIALTGDYIETAEDIPTVTALVEQLSDIAPVYFTSGNHDWASGAIPELREAVEAAGGDYLANEYLPVERDGAQIIVAGVEDPNGPLDQIKPDALMEQVNEAYPDSFIVLLAHRNDFAAVYPDIRCDIVLTGHGHGGVVRLPMVGGLLGTDMRFFPKYDAGVFHMTRARMIVSRGLAPVYTIPRFLNNPDIVLITLHHR